MWWGGEDGNSFEAYRSIYSHLVYYHIYIMCVNGNSYSVAQKVESEFANCTGKKWRMKGFDSNATPSSFQPIHVITIWRAWPDYVVCARSVHCAGRNFSIRVISRDHNTMFGISKSHLKSIYNYAKVHPRDVEHHRVYMAFTWIELGPHNSCPVLISCWMCVDQAPELITRFICVILIV